MKAMKIICSALAGLSVLWSVYCMFASWGFGLSQLLVACLFPLLCYIMYDSAREHKQWKENNERYQRFLDELRRKEERAAAERAARAANKTND
ncbi:MAG: hypothetical protein Q4A61_03485 [Porphyromonadaceae bacterium]|nr:hypothetical protein [Porphyromonadaceae bacterium]